MWQRHEYLSGSTKVDRGRSARARCRGPRSTALRGNRARPLAAMGGVGSRFGTRAASSGSRRQCGAAAPALAVSQLAFNGALIPDSGDEHVRWDSVRSAGADCAVDTNVLLDVFQPDERYGRESQQRLSAAYDAGAVAVSDVVYAELTAAFPNRTLDRALREINATTSPNNTATSRSRRECVGKRYRESGGPRNAHHHRLSDRGACFRRRGHLLNARPQFVRLPARRLIRRCRPVRTS